MWRHRVEIAILMWILFLNSSEYSRILKPARPEPENDGNRYLASLTKRDSWGWGGGGRESELGK